VKRGKIVVLCIVAALVLGRAGSALAVTDTADQSVTVTVSEIAELAVNGGAVSLTIAAPGTPGSLPSAVTDAATSLAWTSNVAGAFTRTITAALDSDMPASVTLKATLTKAGGNGTAAAQQTLSSVAATLFTGITNENVTGNTITYEAAVSAMVAPQTISRTVTWTLTEDS